MTGYAEGTDLTIYFVVPHYGFQHSVITNIIPKENVRFVIHWKEYILWRGQNLFQWFDNLNLGFMLERCREPGIYAVECGFKTLVSEMIQSGDEPKWEKWDLIAKRCHRGNIKTWELT